MAKKRNETVDKIVCMLRDEGYNTAQIFFITERINEVVQRNSYVSPDYSPKLEK